MRKLRFLLTLGFLLMLSFAKPSFAGQWIDDAGGRWYQKDDGSYYKDMAAQFKDSSGNPVWYVFDKNGYLVKDAWYKTSDGRWHLSRPDGRAIANSYAYDGGNWYIFRDTSSALVQEIAYYEHDQSKSGVYYNRDTKQDEAFLSVDSSFHYLTIDESTGVIKSGFTHTVRGGLSVPAGQKTDGTAVKQYTEDEVWAIADRYAPALPGIQHLYLYQNPLLLGGYDAYYTSRSGGYKVTLVMNYLTGELEYSKGSYT